MKQLPGVFTFDTLKDMPFHEVLDVLSSLSFANVREFCENDPTEYTWNTKDSKKVLS